MITRRASGRRLQRLWLHSLQYLLLLVVMLSTSLTHAAEDYLPPEQAFQLSARMVDAGTLELSYRIADGYYMY
ncbi:protein-disulfide reductase DsbD domain-containing protein, partial [Klebsiella pneumoniae]|uniref:protein-disulfide reductase DsbD domain-containing protein n=2 Tax=Pseudomonadota TaxID=1224 RepID=UPI001D194810